ncbi:MAG: M14 family zinc carboxypeptidase [Pyrinomonadaceae bacterium]
MKETAYRFCMLLMVSLCVAASFFGQGKSYQWLEGAEYDTAIPSPKQFLGYEIGDYLTDNLQMVSYIHELERKSPRVKVFQYGETVERRKLWLVAISSPKNMARLEEIRLNAKRLTDPRATSPEEARKIADTTIPIAWMNFANDGGETSAFEAGLMLAYQLSAGTDPLTTRILDNSVVLIDPAFNPDSHQAFVAWAKNSTIRGGTADPQSAEHFVDWFASSDGNHYKIDINRDGFALTQRETQAGARMLNHWNPQVWIDMHGEPNEYYMAPFTAPMNGNYPESLRKWAETIGRNSGKYFDKYGWTYAKDEDYDLYFPGYWDSYPAFNGAIAATYESNGGGGKGFRWERPDGTVVTFREAIHKHFIADMATLETLVEHRVGILNDFYGFFKSGMDSVSKEKIKSYVIHESDDPGRATDLVETLLRHQIEVYRTSKPVAAKRSANYFDRTIRAETFEAGSFVIPLRQPKKRLIKTLFEPDPEMEPGFMKTVAERLERDAKLGTDSEKEGPGFYDITAWALPLHYDVATSFTEDEISVAAMDRIERKPSEFTQPGKANYAYAFSGAHNSGMKLAANLLQLGFNVAITLRPTTVNGITLPKGTFIARVIRNPETLHAEIQRLASQCGATVRPLDTAWGEGGISLGSGYVRDLHNPKIMVVTNEPTQAVTFGSVYSVLDQRFDLAFSAVKGDMVANADLRRYTVIVLPDGSPSGYERILGKKGIEKLRNWVDDGGTLVALKGGAAFTTLPAARFTDVDMILTQAGAEEPIERIPGSIFKATVNNDHYLALGVREEVPVLFRGNYHLTPTKTGANVAVYKPGGHLMGQVWDSTMKNLGGKLYMADVPLGRGHVVLFADDPTFRAYWNGLDRLFIGSIILPSGF